MAGYLEFSGKNAIKGESTAAGFEDQIEITSISENITRAIMAGGSGAQRQRSSATLGDIVCSKDVDKSSPKLAEAICKGAVFGTVKIALTTSSEGGSGRTAYFTFELTNARVTSYGFSGSTDGAIVPSESLSLNFEKIKWTYDELDKENNSKGKVETQWSTEEGTA